MKILFYVVGFIATCFLGFYIIGVVKPVVNYETSITINRSAEQTWSVLSNDSLMSQWIQGFEKIEITNGEPFLKESTYKIYLKDAKQSFINEYKVINVMPNELYEYQLDNTVLKNHITISLSTPKEFTTTLKITNSVEAKNWFLSSLFVFFKSQFQSQDEITYTALKKLVEMDPEIKK
jgi:uncharacterized protein YndB with AHSA1/START domain